MAAMPSIRMSFNGYARSKRRAAQSGVIQPSSNTARRDTWFRLASRCRLPAAAMVRDGEEAQIQRPSSASPCLRYVTILIDALPRLLLHFLLLRRRMAYDAPPPGLHFFLPPAAPQPDSDILRPRTECWRCQRTERPLIFSPFPPPAPPRHRRRRRPSFSGDPPTPDRQSRVEA